MTERLKWPVVHLRKEANMIMKIADAIEEERVRRDLVIHNLREENARLRK